MERSTRGDRPPAAVRAHSLQIIVPGGHDQQNPFLKNAQVIGNEHYGTQIYASSGSKDGPLDEVTAGEGVEDLGLWLRSRFQSWLDVFPIENGDFPMSC